jgi:hypothetical protein
MTELNTEPSPSPSPTLTPHPQEIDVHLNYTDHFFIFVHTDEQNKIEGKKNIADTTSVKIS